MYYELKCLNSNNVLTSILECNTNTITQEKSCIIKMSSLQAQLNLSLFSIVTCFVRGKNYIGFGKFSIPSKNIIIKSYPQTMSSISRGSNTNSSQLEIYISNITNPQNGGSEVTNLEVTISSETLIYPFSNTIILQAPDFTINDSAEHNVIIKAINVYGTSTQSSSLNIYAATVPGKVQNLSNEYNEENILVNWDSPINKGGNTMSITSYNIQVYATDGIYYDIAACDNNTIFSTLSCKFQLLLLKNEPYNIPFNSLIKFKVVAQNEVGWGTEEIIQSIHMRSKPNLNGYEELIIKDDSLSDSSTMVVNFPILTDNDDSGGVSSDTLTYTYYYSSPTVSETSITEISPGKISFSCNTNELYTMRFEATNIYGTSISLGKEILCV